MTAYLDIIEHGQIVKESDILKCTGDAQGCHCFGLLAADRDGAVLFGKYNSARGWFLNTGNAIKKGRLAGTVRTDKTDDLTAVDVKADIFKGFQAAKAFVKLFYF
jgi:hypothetical protein